MISNVRVMISCCRRMIWSRSAGSACGKAPFGFDPMGAGVALERVALAIRGLTVKAFRAGYAAVCSYLAHKRFSFQSGIRPGIGRIVKRNSVSFDPARIRVWRASASASYR